MIKAQAVSFGYGKQEVLKNISLEVQQGEILALIGPNGAGKTTLLKLLAGLLHPRSGSVQVLEPRAKHVAYLAQSESLPLEFSVQEIVAFGRLPHQGLLGVASGEDKLQIEKAMQATDTTQFATRRVQDLSGGEKQRVALARALAQNPKVLLLDEPTNHLDLAHQSELMQLLSNLKTSGLSVVMVVHDLIVAARADRVALLHNGQLQAIGKPEEVLEIPLLERVYQTKLECLTTQDGRMVIIAI